LCSTIIDSTLAGTNGFSITPRYSRSRRADSFGPGHFYLSMTRRDAFRREDLLRVRLRIGTRLAPSVFGRVETLP
jgi:hypothetical protein